MRQFSDFFSNFWAPAPARDNYSAAGYFLRHRGVIIPPPAVRCRSLIIFPLVVLCEQKWGGEDEVSCGHSNLRGWSGKRNPAGGRVRGATEAINRRGRSAGRHNF